MISPEHPTPVSPTVVPLPVVRRATAEQLAGGTIAVLAADASLASARSVLRGGTPGVPPHRHLTSSELFVVISGAVEALLGDEILHLESGDSFVASPGVTHALAAAPGHDAELLVITSPPADRPDYYRLLDAMHRGTATGDDLLASQERFDSYFVESDRWTNRSDTEATR